MTPTPEVIRTLIERVEQGSGPDHQRFWGKVDRSGDCWLWTASTNQKGYGQFSLGSRVRGTYQTVRAHRYAYETLIGTIPKGMHLDHTCYERRCVNPLHLEPVTASVNNKRAGASKDTCWRGHPFTPENTLIGRNGTRECRECRLERKRRYRREGRAHSLRLAPRCSLNFGGEVDGQEGEDCQS